MSFQFKRARKTQKKLRMALMGPSGAGKSFTALMLATALAEGGPIALLDTERGSASLYSDRFTFDSCELESFNPQHYIDAINASVDAGYSVLIIDSLSHAWSGEGGVLDQVNKRGGNSFTDGWGKVGTPLQNSLMKAILEAPLHIIATMRVKTEYAVEQNDKGKSVPKRIGLAAVQRDGVEYEFDIIGVLDIQNTLSIEKTRMVELSGTIINKPDAKLAQKILAWLSDGAPAPAAAEQQQQQRLALTATDERARYIDRIQELWQHERELGGAPIPADELNPPLANRSKEQLIELGKRIGARVNKLADMEAAKDDRAAHLGGAA